MHNWNHLSFDVISYLTFFFAHYTLGAAKEVKSLLELVIRAEQKRPLLIAAVILPSDM